MLRKLAHDAEIKAEQLVEHAEAAVEELYEEVEEKATNLFVGQTETQVNRYTLESVRNIKEDLIHQSLLEEEDKPKHWVDTTAFKTTILGLTLAHTLQMGLEADNPNWKSTWVICENIVTAGFFVEMVCKLCSYKLRYFYEWGNWLDGILTALAVVDCWILAGVSGSAGDMDLQSLSVLRILRLLRLARVLKLVRTFKPLVLVIQGVVKAMSTAAYVFGLLVFIFYVFAILLTEHLGKSSSTHLYPGFTTDEEIIDKQDFMRNYNPYICFGSMLSSMVTLFNMATLTEWVEVIRPIALKQPLYLPVFVLFGLFVSFGVMNVLIAVVVDVVIGESRRIEHNLHDYIKKAKLKTLEQIQVLLADLDVNADGVIDLGELQKAMDGNQNSYLMELLHSIDLPRGWASHELMDMLDNNGDGNLQYGEFTTSFFRLLDSNDFQQICIMQASINQLKHMIRDQNKKASSRHSRIEADIASIKAALGIATDSQRMQPAGTKPGGPRKQRSNSGTGCEVQIDAQMQGQLAESEPIGQQNTSQGEGPLNRVKVTEDLMADSLSDVPPKLMMDTLTACVELEKVLTPALLLLKKYIHEGFDHMKVNLDSQLSCSRSASTGLGAQSCPSLGQVAETSPPFSDKPSNGAQQFSAGGLNPVSLRADGSPDGVRTNESEIVICGSKESQFDSDLENTSCTISASELPWSCGIFRPSTRMLQSL